jgi:hypothetical protein
MRVVAVPRSADHHAPQRHGIEEALHLRRVTPSVDEGVLDVMTRSIGLQLQDEGVPSTPGWLHHVEGVEGKVVSQVYYHVEGVEGKVVSQVYYSAGLGLSDAKRSVLVKGREQRTGGEIGQRPVASQVRTHRCTGHSREGGKVRDGEITERGLAPDEGWQFVMDGHGDLLLL